MKAPLFPHAIRPEQAELVKAMAEWERLVRIGAPAYGPSYIHTVCEEIVKRAEIIASQHPVNFFLVAGFFLERTQAWVMTGLPVEQIGPKLPKNLTDLGVMKMTEGSDVNYGGALTKAELAPVVKHFKKIVH